jgi:hypothetical protein
VEDLVDDEDEPVEFDVNVELLIGLLERYATLSLEMLFWIAGD